MNDLLNYIDDKDLRLIADKVAGNIRITPEEGLLLYKKPILLCWVSSLVLSGESITGILLISIIIFTLNQLTNAYIIAGSVLIINRKEILKAGNTVMKRCLIL